MRPWWIDMVRVEVEGRRYNQYPERPGRMDLDGCKWHS